MDIALPQRELHSLYGDLYKTICTVLEEAEIFFCLAMGSLLGNGRHKVPLAWYGCVDFGHYHEDRTHFRRVLESAGLIVLGMSDGVLRVCLAEGTAISSVRGHRALGKNRKHTWPWADFFGYPQKAGRGGFHSS